MRKITIKDNMKTVLEALAKAKRDEAGEAWTSGKELQKTSGLSPANINDAVKILKDKGLVETLESLGTAPFNFQIVTITAHGRLELE